MMNSEKNIFLQMSWQQLALVFFVGVFAALLVDAVRYRFFKPSEDIFYVQLGEFMGENIKKYGSHEFASENEQLKLAMVFTQALESSIAEMQIEHGQPIFSGPALVSGGMDLTAELDFRVSEKMDRYVLNMNQ